MAEASREFPAFDFNIPYHHTPHPAAAVAPSSHHCFPFHPHHQSCSFHCPCILPLPPPPFSFPHGSQTQHLPAFLPFFLGKSSSSSSSPPAQCQQLPPHGPPPPPHLRAPFWCRHCGAWNNTFFSPPSLIPILPPHAPTVFSQPADRSIPPQSLKPIAEECDPQYSYDRSLRVGLDDVEEAEEGVEEYAEEEEEEDDDEEDPQFVLTDEWLEFFAKSEARRKEKKRQQKKEAKAARKAARMVISQPKASDAASFSEDVVCAFETGLLPSSGAEFDADKLRSVVASASAMSHPAPQSINEVQESRDGMESPLPMGFDHSGTEESTLVTRALSSGYLASTVAEGVCDELESGDHPLNQHTEFNESQTPEKRSVPL